MKPEELAIIDTAVKIGLGALISGVTAYCLAINKYSSEKKSKETDREIEILKEISLKIEKAKFKLDESCHPFWHYMIDGEPSSHSSNVKIAIDHLLEALSVVGQARAMSLLIAETVLSEKLHYSETLINELYKIFSSEDLSSKALKCNELMEKIKDVLNECHGLLSQAYKSA